MSARAGSRRSPEVVEDLALLLARMLDTVDQAGVADRTLVVVAAPTSQDLAFPLGERSLLLPYQQAATPLFLSLPGVIPEGKTREAPVGSMDVLPLVRRLLGGADAPPPGARDLLAMAREEEVPGPPVISTSVSPWTSFGLAPLVSVATAERRLIMAAGGEWELLSWQGTGEARSGRGRGDVGLDLHPSAAPLAGQARRVLAELLPRVEASEEARDPRETTALGSLFLARRLLLSGGEAGLGRAARELESAAVVALGGPGRSRLVARWHLARGETTLALAAAREALDFHAGSSPPTGLVELELEILLEQGLPGEARDRAARARALHPRSARLAELEARALLEGGQVEECLSLLEQSPTVRSPGIWLVVGRAHETAGRPHEAIEAYRRSLRLDSSQREARVRSGRLLLSLGRFAEAAEQLVAASRVGRDDPDPALAYECGRAFEGLGDAESALLAYETSRRNGLEVHASTWRIGFLLSAIGKSEAALVELRSLAEQAPSFPHGYHDLIRLLLGTGQGDEALRWATALVERFGEDGASHLLRGLTLSRLGREQEAGVAMRRGVVLEPSPGALNELAWLLLTASDEEIRDPQEALALARAAAAADPGNLDFADTLARALLARGDDAEALRETLRIGEALLAAERAADARNLLLLARGRFPTDPELARLLVVSEGEGGE